MTPYDDAVLVFYFGFMIAIGWIFRRFVYDVSDYFRGGGKAVWWMVGGSAFMVAFSAWTFTGAASKAYADGWPIVVIYFANAVGFLLSALYFAPRFRQLRVVTAIQAIRQRFGPVSEQVFVWLQIPLSTLQAGVWLNALGVFFGALFGFDLVWTMVITGSVVVCMALLGGTWAVLAGDFIQSLILMPISLAVTVLALARLGGWEGFTRMVPPAHLDLSEVFTKEFLGLWCMAMLFKQIGVTNNLLEANRFLSVKDSRHARWAGFLGAGLFMLGIGIWFIPPMAARALWPDMAVVMPGLRNPEEASFIAIAREVMPVGMMGLLVSGIFASTMSSMDTGLNKNAGIFIKNFYQPLLRPRATELEMLGVGRAATVVLGILVISVAIWMSRSEGLGLFLLMQRVSILVGVPVTVPLVLGLLIRNTPPWSAWSTVVVGFTCSVFVGILFPPEWAAGVFGYETPLDASSREYWTQGFQLFATATLASIWFFATRAFWGRVNVDDRNRIDAFFVQMHTPVDFDHEEGAEAANDGRQRTVIGWLCVAYGGFVVLLAAIPNPIEGRLVFVGCGAIVLLVAGLLLGWIRLKGSRSP